MVSGFASQNPRKEILYGQTEAAAVSEIYHPCCFCDSSADVCNEFDRMGDPFFCKYICPQGVLEGAIPLSIGNAAIRSALGKLFSFKFGILITVVVLSILFYRPFCKWICPLGAIYSLFNKVSFYISRLKTANVSDAISVPGHVKWISTCAGPQIIRNASDAEPASRPARRMRSTISFWEKRVRKRTPEINSQRSETID